MNNQNRKIKKATFFGRLYPLLLGLSLAAALGMGQMGPLRSGDLKFMDLAFRLRGPREVPDNVIILAIDEESFQRVEEPLILWSGKFALVFEYLAYAGARVLGFDLIQSKSFNTYIADDNQRLLEVVDEINTNGRPGLVFAFLPNKNLYPFDELQFLLAEADGLGYANLTLDEDKIVRRHELFALDDNTIVPSFSLLICSKYLGIEPESVVRIFGEDISAGSDGDMESQMIINFTGPHGTLPRVDFATTLEKAEQGDTTFFRDRFFDRVVLIGIDTFDDTAPVAYAGHWNESVLMSGVEIHANTINTILTGENIRETGPFEYKGIPFVLFAILLCYLYSRIPLGWGLGAAVSMALLLLLSWKALFALNIFIALTAPLALLVLSPLTVYSYRFLMEGKDKRRIKKIFRTYVNEVVLDELMSKEDYSVFSVKRKHVALMFTDVRNFTTLSEPLDPEVVARILNEYMTEMCKAIFQFGGTVNKFIGDGIMAIWGAPLNDPDACLHAVQAGLRMLELLEDLNRRWEPLGYPHFEIGVGIHYDNVAVGYLGHPDRMEYTALGDGVNMASRVEGLNKQLKTNILITEEVYRFVKDEVYVSSPQLLPIKGRSDVKVYPVVGMKGEPK